MKDLIQAYSKVVKLGLLSNHLKNSNEHTFTCDDKECATCLCYNLDTNNCKLTELIKGKGLSMETFERKHIYPILLKSNPEYFL